MCGVTHSRLIYYAREFTDVTGVIHMCDSTHPHVWRDSFVGVRLIYHVWRDSLICVTWLIYYARDVTHAYVWRDSFVGVRLTHYVWRDSFMCDVTHLSCVTWLMHMCGVTHSYVCDLLFRSVLWHVAHLYLWCDFLICVAALIRISAFYPFGTRAASTESPLWRDTSIFGM